MVGVRPEIFLHPQLADSIPLECLAWLMSYQEPGLTATALFDKLREPLWKTASLYPEWWMRDLPPAIWNQTIDGVTKMGPLPLTRPLSTDYALVKLMPRLTEAFGHVERAYETARCMQGFQIEFQYLLETGDSFRDWQQLPVVSVSPSDPLVWLLSKGSELVEL